MQYLHIHVKDVCVCICMCIYIYRERGRVYKLHICRHTYMDSSSYKRPGGLTKGLTVVSPATGRPKPRRAGCFPGGASYAFFAIPTNGAQKTT